MRRWLDRLQELQQKEAETREALHQCFLQMARNLKERDSGQS